MIYYVDINSVTGGNGSREMPFRNINDAALIASPGDEIVVAPAYTANMSYPLIRVRKMPV